MIHRSASTPARVNDQWSVYEYEAGKLNKLFGTPATQSYRNAYRLNLKFSALGLEKLLRADGDRERNSRVLVLCIN